MVAPVTTGILYRTLLMYAQNNGSPHQTNDLVAHAKLTKHVTELLKRCMIGTCARAQQRTLQTRTP
jgi:hypothetical protein